MKRICYLLFLAILASSCSTYQATVQKHDKLPFDALKVHPSWEYKDPKAKKAILPIIGGAIGGIYGYQNETSYGGDTLVGAENASLWALGGAFAGGIANGIIFPKRNYRRSTFDLSQSEKWINSFNKTSDTEYVITRKELDNTLVLMPKSNVIAFRQKYRRLENDLTKVTPSTDFQTLQNWKHQLDGTYSALPEEEIREAKNLIETHEEKVANISLLERASFLQDLDNSDASLKEANAFMGSNRAVFQSASLRTQRKVQDQLAEKIDQMLDVSIAQETDNLGSLSISELNAFSKRLNSKYRDFSTHPRVQKANQQIADTKVQKVLNQLDRVEAKIAAAEHIKEVAELEARYLSLLEREGNPQIVGLSDKLSRRKIEIKEEKKRRKEREEWERKMAEVQALERYGFRFEIDGLSNKELIKNIFYGNFIDIPFKRNELVFAALIEEYMYTYARNCPSPTRYNQVQIMERKCSRKWVEKNIYGSVISEDCIEWVDVGTGLYTSPELYHAFGTIKGIVQRDGIEHFWQILNDMMKGGMGSVNAMAAESAALQSDIHQLIQMNGCNNKALKRFEANLIQFATNQPPIKLDGRQENNTVDYDENQNLDKLVKDLVYADSKSWTFQYIHNSVSNVRVVSRDSQQRPQKITATYRFNGFANGQQDQVQITFKEGIPDCLYYLTYSSNCETPDRKIVSDFVKGEYIQE